MRSEEIIGSLERKYLLDLLSQKNRMDGRGFFDSRPIEIIPNVIKKAEGSAMVKWGETIVLAGVKTSIGAPFPDTPDDGVITVNAEMSPISSPTQESGPPGPDAIELARVVDRGIRESKVIPMQGPKICIIPGKYVWVIFIDVYILDDGGNLFDSSALAAMAALANTKINKVEVDDETGEISLLEEKEYLPRNGTVSSLTYIKINENILYDPNLMEDRGKEARFSLAIKDDGMICSMQKGESGVFSETEISQIIEHSISQARELHQLIEEASKKESLHEMFE